MTDTEIRIAIAEVCGHKFTLAALQGCPCDRCDGTAPPDYPNDLNAMHEAWANLDRKQRTAFSRILREVVVKAGGHASSFNEDIVACCENATARQRAEAFLRTLNLWKD